VADEKRGWKQFQKLTFDSKKLSKRVKKAEGATVRHARKFILTRFDSILTVRRHIVAWLLLVGLMIGTVGLQFMWFQQNYQTKAPSEGGTYAEALLGPIDTLNPLYASSSAEMAASRLIFSSLFTYDATGHLHGDLAQSMTIDPTSTIYTVKLRPNVKWHDGTTLTAQDVAFTVNLIKNPQALSSLRVNWQDVSVKALDDTTVQFQLPAVYAAFPHALTFSVLPQHILGNVAAGAVRENSFSRSPVGSGPFSFRLLQSADTSNADKKIVHMTAFADYYAGKPRLSRFEIHAYATQDEIMQALRTGEVDAASNLSGDNIAQVNTHNYDITEQPVDSGVYALLNTETPILKDKLVRQALQLGTNTTAIRDKLGINAPALDLPFINGQLTGSDVPHAPSPDVKKATALLDQDGWKLVGDTRQKDGQKLSLTVATTKNPQYEKALQTLVGQWRQLGVAVTTNVIDTADPTTNFVQNTLQARNYDVLLFELFIGADPDVYAYWHSSQIGINGYNFSNYSNSTADAALASARSRLEPDLRNAKYETFARQWIDDVPAIGLYQSTVAYVTNHNVQSISPSAQLISAEDRYSNVLYWSVGQDSVYKTP
jgi:peptide/nickel transport system substrate-binding protein